MLTIVASWIAMTNAVSAAAICSRAEVPPSSESDAGSASGKSLPDAVLLQYLCVPFLLNGWELCEATDKRYRHTRHGARRVPVRTGTHSSQPIARKGTHKIKQIARVESEECVTGVYEPNMQHAVDGPRRRRVYVDVDGIYYADSM